MENLILLISACTQMATADAEDLNCPVFVMALRASCLNDMNGGQAMEYPEVITRLPEADIQVKGIRAWVLQGEKHQLVFFEMEPSAQVPEHCHPYVQWGIMIKGKMELTINGETRVCESGDEYTIPAQAKHSAKFLKKCRVMDFFSEKNRYRTK